MKAFFKTYWPWFAGGLFILLVSWGNYAWRVHKHNQLVREQAAAAALIAQREVAAKHRYAAYQLDSTRRATQREALQKMDSTLAHQDDEISTAYPPSLYLPASPPRERAAPAASRSPR